MSVYDGIAGSILGTEAQVLGVITKDVGGSINVQVTFMNTGTADWTYGIGLTLRDSNGGTWNCWTGNIVKVVTGSEGSIDSQFCAKGATVTHTISGIPVLSTMPAGLVQFVVGLWRESTAPPANMLSRYPSALGTWASTDSNGNSITVNNPSSYAASITSIILG